MGTAPIRDHPQLGWSFHINQGNQNNSRGNSLIRGLTKNLTIRVVFNLYYQNKEQGAVFPRPTAWPTSSFTLESFQLSDPGRSVAALPPLQAQCSAAGESNSTSFPTVWVFICILGRNCSELVAGYGEELLGSCIPQKQHSHSSEQTGASLDNCSA